MSESIDKSMVIKLRNKVALTGAYLLLRYVATPVVRDRAEQALASGLHAQGVVDLWGTSARKRTIPLHFGTEVSR